MAISLIEALPSLFGFGGKSSTPAPTPVPDNSAAKAAAATQEKEAIARQAPDLQTQLGGAVAPEYYADLAAKNAGFAGDTNQSRNALSSFFGGETSDLIGPASATPKPESGGKSIFEELIARQGSDDDKGVSGGFSA